MKMTVSCSASLLYLAVMLSACFPSPGAWAMASSSGKDARQEEARLLQSAHAITWRLIVSGRTLQALAYQRQVARRISTTDRRRSAWEIVGQMLPLVGVGAELEEPLPGFVPLARFRPAARLPGGAAGDLVPHDAISAIVKEARAHRIVIINEAHDVSLHRNFSKRLALALRKVGFRYLALETLVNFAYPADDVVRRGYPLRRDGYYLNDPVFADFLRTALRAGYRLIRYEKNWRNPSSDPPVEVCDKQAGESWVTAAPEPEAAALIGREKQQACNIFQRVFVHDPGARVLIHVGYGHLYEEPEEDDGHPWGMMAAYLKAYTGFDPLTIDQTHGTLRKSIPDTVLAPSYVPFLLALHDRYRIRKPSVFTHPDGSFIVDPTLEGKVDMTVFHEPERLVEGRPHWWAEDPDRFAVSYHLPSDLAAAESPFVLEAVDPKEGDAPIPFDAVYCGITCRSGTVTLFLPPGTYTLRVQLMDGRFRSLGDVQVHSDGAIVFEKAAP